MFEADFEQKLAARGDYEEHSTYSKSFRGLSSIVLYNCADVLISLDPATDGQCAAVLVPREEQHIMRLTVRSVEKDNPFVGRLESYGDLPEFEVLDAGGVPSIKMAVDLIAIRICASYCSCRTGTYWKKSRIWINMNMLI